MTDLARFHQPPIDTMSIDISDSGPGGSIDLLKLKGKFFVEHYDKDGNLKGKYPVNNGITNAGKNSILDVYFNSGTPLTTWYIGLIDNGVGSNTLAAGDTLASHAGWAEFTNYSGNRVAWGQGAASSQQVTNASPATFTITGGGGTLYGIFVCTVNTGTSGVLWSTAAFSATVPVVAGDQMKVTYTLAT